MRLIPIRNCLVLSAPVCRADAVLVQGSDEILAMPRSKGGAGDSQLKPSLSSGQFRACPSNTKLGHEVSRSLHIHSHPYATAFTAGR